jgi:hypothetical protein
MMIQIEMSKEFQKIENKELEKNKYYYLYIRYK